jgi:hypothetical protein
MIRSVAASVVLLASLSFAACQCGGDHSVIEAPDDCAKRLRDNKESLDLGVITQEDYDKIKKKIVKDCS